MRPVTYRAPVDIEIAYQGPVSSINPAIVHFFLSILGPCGGRRGVNFDPSRQIVTNPPLPES
jgi:hypothetical protein